MLSQVCCLKLFPWGWWRGTPICDPLFVSRNRACTSLQIALNGLYSPTGGVTKPPAGETDCDVLQTRRRSASVLNIFKINNLAESDRQEPWRKIR